MSETEFATMLAFVILIVAGYIGLGVWLWRECESAPLDPEDSLSREFEAAKLNTRKDGFWDV